ncbi:MAG: ABC transporter permease, partial [Clostridiales bacterium]|nr:ABC transporter permease [Clostridiales bacterium]
MEFLIKLLNVAYYKLKMMLADKLFFTVMIVLPLLIAAASGFSLRYEKLDTIPVAIVDEDGGSYSRLLISRLQQEEGISLVEADRSKALDLLEGSSAEQVYIIKQGFSEAISMGEADGMIETAVSPSSFSSSYTSEVIAASVERLLSGNMAVSWLEEHGWSYEGKTAAEARAEII